jgi:hypothetical protein
MIHRWNNDSRGVASLNGFDTVILLGQEDEANACAQSLQERVGLTLRAKDLPDLAPDRVPGECALPLLAGG